VVLARHARHRAQLCIVDLGHKFGRERFVDRYDVIELNPKKHGKPRLAEAKVFARLAGVIRGSASHRRLSDRRRNAVQRVRRLAEAISYFQFSV
jgi:hypothetical protein